MSDSHDPVRVLAYALEEAGRPKAHLLQHCREPGPHARDCSPVNALLAMT